MSRSRIFFPRSELEGERSSSPHSTSPRTRLAAFQNYETFKFRALRATLLIGSWTFGVCSFPHRFFFSNRSVNTM